MKRIYTIVSLALLSLLAASCVDKPIDTEGPERTGYLTVGTYSDTEYKIAKGKSKTVLLTANAAEDAVCSDFIKLTFKVDPTLVDSFNVGKDSAAVLLPSAAYQFVSNEVMMAKYNRNSTTAELKLSGNDLELNTIYVLPVTIDQITGSDKCFVADDAPLYIVVRKEFSDDDKGDGSAATPFIITTVKDFMAIPEMVEAGRTTYFKLGADIDLTDQTWVAFNTASPYDKAINFNGQGHVVKNLTCTAGNYPSFMGVVVGEIYDVTFENALIEGTSAAGILGGYIGTTVSGAECKANVHGVHVSGTVNANGSNGVGGLAGRCGPCVIDRCSADVTVNSPGKNYIGGLVGYDANPNVVISNCWTSGELVSGQRCGGVVGGFIKAGSKMINCYSTMSVTAGFAVGGIAGHCCLDMKADANGNTKADKCHSDNTFEGCISWNTLVATKMADGNNNYSSGAVVGYTSIFNTLKNCWRKADASAYMWAADKNVLKDMEDCSESSPMPIICDPASEYIFSYHGKAAAAGETCSAVAKRIGWDETIWDLSGELPKLK